MGIWAGYLGASNPESLRRLLGQGAQVLSGAGYALGIVNAGGEPARLSVEAEGVLRASIGSDERAGSSAAFSPAESSVTLACDSFGLHSVYTAQIEGVFWFASDLRLLRLLLGNSARLDPVALHAYLCFSSVPAPLSVLSGVSAIPAGGEMRLLLGDERLRDERNFFAGWPAACQRMNSLSGWRSAPQGPALCAARIHPPSDTQPPTLKGRGYSGFWIERDQKPAMSEGDASERLAAVEDLSESVSLLRKRLREAVQRPMGSAREVGVFLSGGLDSSLIAALLAEAGVRLHLFSLDFGPPYNDELPFAHAVAAHLGRPLHVIPCGPRQVKTALRPTAIALEQPSGDGVTVPLYLLGKAAAQVVGTVFNGEGGDQLFGGWNNKPMIAAELYGAEDYDREAAYLATYHRFYGLTDRLYTPRVRALLQNVDVGATIRPSLFPAFSSLLHLLRAANLQLKGAQNIAPRARQLAAAHGLCVRAPFFDPDLAAWTFTLPSEWFLQGACEKYLLKRVAENYLPSEVVWREKRGMGVPATEWCLGGLRREVGRLLSPRRLRRDGWFDAGFVAALRKGEDEPGEFRRRRLGEKIWLLAMLMVWQEVHQVAFPALALSNKTPFTSV